LFSFPGFHCSLEPLVSPISHSTPSGFTRPLLQPRPYLSLLTLPNTRNPNPIRDLRVRERASDDDNVEGECSTGVGIKGGWRGIKIRTQKPMAYPSSTLRKERRGSRRHRDRIGSLCLWSKVGNRAAKAVREMVTAIASQEPETLDPVNHAVNHEDKGD